MRNPFTSKRRTESSSQALELPAVLEANLGGIALKFEALVKEDYSRIQRFDGEGEYFAALLEELRPSDDFVDVGAFTGQVSCFAAARCNKGRVLAVEPDPEFVTRIQKNLDLNRIKNVTVAPVGVADLRGELLLNTSGGLGWAPSFVDKGMARSIEIPVTTLDQLFEDYQIAPSVIKIDVEGFEGKVFQGAATALRSTKLRAVFVEFHPSLLLKSGEDVGKTIGMLGDYGFRFEEFAVRKNEINAIARRVTLQ